MSDASHGSEAHAPHAHEVFEGKAADSIPPDEPHTPGWLPIVGAALVLAGIMAFALSGPGGQAEPAAVASAAAPAEAPPAPAPAPAELGERRPQQRPMPPAGSVMRLPGLPSGMPRPMRRPPPGDAPPAPPPGAQPRPAP